MSIVGTSSCSRINDPLWLSYWFTFLLFLKGREGGSCTTVHGYAGVNINMNNAKCRIHSSLDSLISENSKFRGTCSSPQTCYLGSLMLLNTWAPQSTVLYVSSAYQCLSSSVWVVASRRRTCNSRSVWAARWARCSGPVAGSSPSQGGGCTLSSAEGLPPGKTNNELLRSEQP